ncbi:FMN-binding negative transcriptional regulator [Luteibacter yeojuensis]|uniref:Transcriptional regulator n=1 Tax=Luteibacter yeojuensis TaxID=345309 RepID=A0A0F3L003_9GAMM|nr:FMN-binding negative transcriptional regulator [Luteibacter yeojuensis]KJV36726.1 transcriptional regulator [Luteibacter yeojuensis]
MYTPALFAETDAATLHALLSEHSLGMLVTHGAGGLDANHIPFLLDEARGPAGTLVAHVARANALWRDGRDGDEVLVVFRGASGYVSPNWYPSKHEHHRHVPTWNYEAVHVHGTLRIIDDEKYVRGVVARLTREHEAKLPEPWRMSDAPADYLAEQLAHIVGIEVAITRWEGKRKLSQNRTPTDFEGAVAGVEGSGNVALAAAMRGARKPGM